MRVPDSLLISPEPLKLPAVFGEKTIGHKTKHFGSIIKSVSSNENGFDAVVITLTASSVLFDILSFAFLMP